MGMVIHDDFWAATQILPDKQQGDFLLAICKYGFTGEEPKGTPPWLPCFTLVRDRIRLGNEKSKKGRDMANARWEKERKKNGDAAANAAANAAEDAAEDAEAYAQAYAQAYAEEHAPEDARANADANAAASCTGNAQAMQQAYAEDEDEIEVENKPPYSPPFHMQCLKAYNDIFVSTYTLLPEKCWMHLERHKDDVTIEQVREMISYKRDEWTGTKFESCLTPQTLFSPEHFEQYLHQSQMASEQKGKEVAEYGVYDR